MDYKNLYEKQYGKKRLVNIPPRQFLGLRKLLKKYAWDRYTIAEQLVNPGDRALDIGCGEGYLLRRLKDKFKELYGLDIASSRLGEAKAKITELYPPEVSRFKFIEGNADEHLPFPDNFFNAITCIAVIEHVYDIFSLVKEIHRVLKPGGYVIAQVPNIAYLKYRISFLIGKLPATSSPCHWEEIGWDGGHIHWFTMKKFCWLFEQQGFKIEKKTGSGFLAKFRNWWPSLLTGDLCIKAQKIKK